MINAFHLPKVNTYTNLRYDKDNNILKHHNNMTNIFTKPCKNITINQPKAMP